MAKNPGIIKKTTIKKTDGSNAPADPEHQTEGTENVEERSTAKAGHSKEDDSYIGQSSAPTTAGKTSSESSDPNTDLFNELEQKESCSDDIPGTSEKLCTDKKDDSNAGQSFAPPSTAGQTSSDSSDPDTNLFNDFEQKKRSCPDDISDTSKKLCTNKEDDSNASQSFAPPSTVGQISSDSSDPDTNLFNDFKQKKRNYPDDISDTSKKLCIKLDKKAGRDSVSTSGSSAGKASKSSAQANDQQPIPIIGLNERGTHSDGPFQEDHESEAGSAYNTSSNCLVNLCRDNFTSFAEEGLSGVSQGRTDEAITSRRTPPSKEDSSSNFCEGTSRPFVEGGFCGASQGRTDVAVMGGCTLQSNEASSTLYRPSVEGSFSGASQGRTEVAVMGERTSQPNDASSSNFSEGTSRPSVEGGFLGASRGSDLQPHTLPYEINPDADVLNYILEPSGFDEEAREDDRIIHELGLNELGVGYAYV